MAGSKITDKIALIAIVAALLVTAAFTRGEALGIAEFAQLSDRLDAMAKETTA